MKMVCDICVNVFLVDPDSTSDENNIVECTQCEIKVHQCCYGVEEFSSTWLCDFCIVQDANQEKICELCPKRDGALKRTTSGKWVHMICALFTSQSIINDPITMSPIDLSAVTKRWFGFMCYICTKNKKKKEGACVKCFVTKCNRYLHVSCGQDACTLQEKSSNKGNLMFIAFCEDHNDRSLPRMPIQSISTMIKGRKRVNYIEKAKKENGTWIRENSLPVSSTPKVKTTSKTDQNGKPIATFPTHTHGENRNFFDLQNTLCKSSMVSPTEDFSRMDDLFAANNSGTHDGGSGRAQAPTHNDNQKSNRGRENAATFTSTFLDGRLHSADRASVPIEIYNAFSAGTFSPLNVPPLVSTNTPVTPSVIISLPQQLNKNSTDSTGVLNDVSKNNNSSIKTKPSHTITSTPELEGVTKNNETSSHSNNTIIMPNSHNDTTQSIDFPDHVDPTMTVETTLSCNIFSTPEPESGNINGETSSHLNNLISVRKSNNDTTQPLAFQDYVDVTMEPDELPALRQRLKRLRGLIQDDRINDDYEDIQIHPTTEIGDADNNNANYNNPITCKKRILKLSNKIEILESANYLLQHNVLDRLINQNENIPNNNGNCPSVRNSGPDPKSAEPVLTIGRHVEDDLNDLPSDQTGDSRFINIIFPAVYGLQLKTQEADLKSLTSRIKRTTQFDAIRERFFDRIEKDTASDEGTKVFRRKAFNKLVGCKINNLNKRRGTRPRRPRTQQVVIADNHRDEE